jgi:hypothetical protein
MGPSTTLRAADRGRTTTPLPGLVSRQGLTNQITKGHSRGDIAAMIEDAHSLLRMCRQSYTCGGNICLIYRRDDRHAVSRLASVIEVLRISTKIMNEGPAKRRELRNRYN